jgi:hypothetical protein
MQTLTEKITHHYQNQLLTQIHVVLLGLDVLGNPFEVIRGVAEGVESLFYEPYKVIVLLFFESIIVEMCFSREQWKVQENSWKALPVERNLLLVQ